MSAKQGRTLPVSLPRRLVGDLLHFAKKIPSIPVQRVINVSKVQRLRTQLDPRMSWCSIFTKAYALTALEFPQLRRAYMPWPTDHIYEHPTSIASVAVERTYCDENAVFFSHLRSPEDQPLRQLDDHLRRYKTAPGESIGLFRRALKISRLPRFLRRWMWWLGLNSSGKKRATRMGTFGVSVYSGLGASSLHPLSPLTSTLNYGVIHPDGSVDVRIIYDHRVMDGSTVARALVRMEQILRTEVADELSELIEEEPYVCPETFQTVS